MGEWGVSVPYCLIMCRNPQLKGRFMLDREEVGALIVRWVPQPEEFLPINISFSVTVAHDS